MYTFIKRVHECCYDRIFGALHNVSWKKRNIKMALSVRLLYSGYISIFNDATCNGITSSIADQSHLTLRNIQH